MEIIIELLKYILIAIVAIAGYQDFKTYKIKNYLIVASIILGIVILGFSLITNWYTNMDLIMIGFVLLLITISILTKQMGLGDIMVIPMVIAWPFPTVLAIALSSLMGFLLGIIEFIKSNIKSEQNKNNNDFNIMNYKMPFMAMFIFNFIIIAVFIPTYLEKPNICDITENDYESLILNAYKYENCSKIVTIYTKLNNEVVDNSFINYSIN